MNLRAVGRRRGPRATEAQFSAVLRGDHGLLWTGFHYRGLIARLYEAERPVLAARQNDQVREFLAGIPRARDHLDFLEDHYLQSDAGESKVRAEFGGMRHRTVHHSWPDSEELRQALEEAAHEEARIWSTGRRSGCTTSGPRRWP